MTRHCPGCGVPTADGQSFCEGCGIDLTAPPPITAWEVTATADHDYFEQTEADGVDFPVGIAGRRFRLDKQHVTIGRQSSTRGIHPDIDLSGPPTDIGISHQHALLVSAPDGSWSILDSGSTNGTYLNENPVAIPRNELTPLAPGDQIHIGAWTTLTVHRPEV